MGTDFINRGSPNDKLKYITFYVIFFFCGIGTLLSWNFFVTALPYFSYKLADPSLPENQRSNIQNNFPGYMSVCSMIPLAVFNVINLFLLRRISLFKLAIAGGTVIFLMIVLTLSLVTVQMNTMPFLIVTLISVVLINASGAIFQGGVLGIAAKLDEKVMRLVLEGQAVAGIIAAAVRLITLATTETPSVEAISFFSVALVFLAVAIIGLALVPGFQYFRQQWTNKMDSSEEKNKEEINLDQKNDIETNGAISSMQCDARSTFSVHKSQLLSVFQSWREVLLPGMCVFLAINLTLIVYPTMLVNIQPTSGGSEAWRRTYFIQVVVFLSYNVFDWLGRLCAGFIKWPKPEKIKILLVLCVLRYAMIPVFMLMNQQPRSLPAPFAHDAFPIIFIILLGLTNGYILTLGFVYAPSFASPGNEAASGVAMNLNLSIGLALGVAIATGLFQLI